MVVSLSFGAGAADHGNCILGVAAAFYAMDCVSDTKRKKQLTNRSIGAIIVEHLRTGRESAAGLKNFLRKVKKVLDLLENVCYINQAVGDGGVKNREAECTL